MSEYIYGLRQRTGRKPVIKKLGAVRAGIEQTPVVFNGRPIMVESRLGGTDGADVQHMRRTVHFIFSAPICTTARL